VSLTANIFTGPGEEKECISRKGDLFLPPKKNNASTEPVSTVHVKQMLHQQALQRADATAELIEERVNHAYQEI
jgi:hypothetical protein